MGTLKMQDRKMRDWKMRHHSAGVEMQDWKIRHQEKYGTLQMY